LLADFPAAPWSQVNDIGNRIHHEYSTSRANGAIEWLVVPPTEAALLPAPRPRPDEALKIWRSTKRSVTSR
jgi:hypothetical protein